MTNWRHQILESHLVGVERWLSSSSSQASELLVRGPDIHRHQACTWSTNTHMHKIDSIFLYFNKRKILWFLIWLSLALGEKIFSRVISLTESSSSPPRDPLQIPESSGSSYDSIYINKFWMFCWNIQAAGGKEILQ